MIQPESWTSEAEIRARIQTYNNADSAHAAHSLGAHGASYSREHIGEKTAEVMDHLREHIAVGETRHFTAREIGGELARPAASVGVSFARIREQAAEFDVSVDNSERLHLWAITRRGGEEEGGR